VNQLEIFNRGLGMSAKVLLLPLLFLFTISSSSIVGSVKYQTDTMDFRFQALAEGQCLIAYGGIGPGVPDPMIWSGHGDGLVAVNGHAADATEFPGTVVGLYISESIRARGVVSLRWREADGSEHQLAVEVYSTEDSEGLFSPSKNQFELSIPEHLSPDRFIMFKGIYADGSESVDISGIALFSGGFLGPAPDSIAVWLFDISAGELFFIGWSRAGTPTPFPPGYVSAAKVFKCLVKIM
jgi:hypothetical protein